MAEKDVKHYVVLNLDKFRVNTDFREVLANSDKNKEIVLSLEAETDEARREAMIVMEELKQPNLITAVKDEFNYFKNYDIVSFKHFTDGSHKLPLISCVEQTEVSRINRNEEDLYDLKLKLNPNKWSPNTK